MVRQIDFKKTINYVAKSIDKKSNKTYAHGNDR